MSILFKSVLFISLVVSGRAFGVECDERLNTSAIETESFAGRQGTVSSFIHISADDALWASTIFGKEAVESDFRGRNMTAGGLVTVLSGRQLDVYWGGHKIQYFDFASGRAEKDPENMGKVVLRGADDLKFIFIYTAGLRRSLEIWVTGISAWPHKRKILTALSGLEFVL